MNKSIFASCAFIFSAVYELGYLMRLGVYFSVVYYSYVDYTRFAVTSIPKVFLILMAGIGLSLILPAKQNLSALFDTKTKSETDLNSLNAEDQKSILSELKSSLNSIGRSARNWGLSTLALPLVFGEHFAIILPVSVSLLSIWISIKHVTFRRFDLQFFPLTFYSLMIVPPFLMAAFSFGYFEALSDITRPSFESEIVLADGTKIANIQLLRVLDAGTLFLQDSGNMKFIDRSNGASISWSGQRWAFVGLGCTRYTSWVCFDKSSGAKYLKTFPSYF